MNPMTQKNKTFKIDQIISRKGALLLAIALTVNCCAYYGGRIFALKWHPFHIETPLDQAIPMIPWTILIYVGCYLFWGVNYLLAVRFEEKDAVHFVKAHVFGEIICFLCFVFFPTTMVRPEITGSGWLNWIMGLVYSVDAPNNLFPSIHCYVSWLCWIGVRKNEKIPAWYRYFSLIFALAVCVSTLTVKQHVIADVIAGVFLAEIGYWIMGR